MYGYDASFPDISTHLPPTKVNPLGHVLVVLPAFIFFLVPALAPATPPTFIFVLGVVVFLIIVLIVLYINSYY
jgi:hypothetical protein